MSKILKYHLKCKFCKVINIIKKDQFEKDLGFKCKECYSINPFKDPTPVIWKCDRPTYQKKQKESK